MILTSWDIPSTGFFPRIWSCFKHSITALSPFTAAKWKGVQPNFSTAFNKPTAIKHNQTQAHNAKYGYFSKSWLAPKKQHKKWFTEEEANSKVFGSLHFKTSPTWRTTAVIYTSFRACLLPYCTTLCSGWGLTIKSKGCKSSFKKGLNMFFFLKTQTRLVTRTSQHSY